MSEDKVWVEKMPENCGDCEFCEKSEYYHCNYCSRLDTKLKYINREKDCPLHSIKDHDRELVNEVLKKVKKIAFKSNVMCDKTGLPCFGEMRQIYGIYDYELDQIQKEFRNDYNL